MSKAVVVSIVVVLLVVCCAFGQSTGALNQIQNTNIGLSNVIDLLNGGQAASALQNLAVQNDQLAVNSHGAYLNQSLFGIFVQIGHASGNSAIVGVLQDLAGVGMQAQVLNDGVGPKTQGQSLSLLASQGILKTEGPGTGNALQQIQLAASQDVGNVAGHMSQSSTILGLQKAAVTGAAAATGQVENSMSVTTVQSQAAL